MMNEKKIIQDLVKIGKIVYTVSIIWAAILVIGGAVNAEAVSQVGGSGLTAFLTYLIISISVYISGYAMNIILNWRAAMLKHAMKK